MSVAEAAAVDEIPVRRKVPFVTIGDKTVADWVAFERTSPTRHELRNGVIVEMAGASYEHNCITADLIRELGNRLEALGSDCEVLGSDQKVYMNRKNGTYPDIIVLCGDPRVDFDEALQNPAAIIEVLSESTAEYDRGMKFQSYRAVESLRHYVLVEQYRPFVEHWARQDDGKWVLAGEHGDLSDELTLTLGGKTVAVPLSRIYRRVAFPAEGAADTVS